MKFLKLWLTLAVVWCTFPCALADTTGGGGTYANDGTWGGKCQGKNCIGKDGRGDSGCDCPGAVEALKKEDELVKQQGLEIYSKLRSTDENGLALLVAMDADVCGNFDCKQVSPNVVRKLASLAQDNNREFTRQEESNRQLWRSNLAIVISIFSLIITTAFGFFEFRHRARQSRERAQ